MCIDMCVDMCIDIYIDMCIDMCVDTGRTAALCCAEFEAMALIIVDLPVPCT